MARRKAIKNIVELYRVLVGSAVPSGAIDISFGIVTVLVNMSWEIFSMPSPNKSLNL